MIYNLLYPLSEHFNFFNVLRYPSFRIVMAALSAGLITFIFYPMFIKKLAALSFGQEVREDGPKSHLKKQGTPTMGGLLLLVAVIVSTIFWADLNHAGIWIMVLVTSGFGFLGFIDDYKKISKSNTLGLSPRAKLMGQFLIAAAALVIYQADFASMPYSSGLSIPFVSVEKFYWIMPSWLFFIFALIVIVGTSNAVNLTDGLDGLAIGPVIISSFVFLILCYLAGTSLGELNLADYLKIPRVDELSELSIFCGAVVGAGIGFLWFNTYPAAVFMGDVGSLSLGAALGTLAVLSKNELLSAILHGVFLLEALSVMIQVGSFRVRKKRVFKMAPIHHHFELLGWAEPKIIVRFWIIAGLLATITLLSLKLR